MRLHLPFACAQLLLICYCAHGEDSGYEAPEHARHSQAHSTEALAHELSPSRLLAAVLNDDVPQQRPRPLRVSVERQRMEALDEPEHSLLDSAANAMVELLKTHLQVRHPPPDGLLGYPPCSEAEDSVRKSTNCTAYDMKPKCGVATIQPGHLADPSTCETSSSGSLQCRSYTGGNGEDTDLYLYLTSVQEDTCNGGAVAWALPCVLDMRTNRPIIAQVNMCPEAITSSLDDGNEDSAPDTVLALMVHEVIHALGFSNSMFSLFVDPDTLEERGANVSRKMDMGGREVTAIVTPTVQREARQQFGCPQLEGANLEDEGGSGSANAHWEWTEYQGDLMLAQRSVASGDPPVISRLTMALLEDTGWYLANWTAAGGPLPFAYNTGCTLPMQGCQAMLEQQQRQSPDMSGSSSSSFLFCSPNQGSSQRTRCTTSLRALGEQCKSEQTFSNGCGMVVAEAPSCTLPSQQYPNPLAFGWQHTPQSRCFDIVLEFQASSGSDQSLETLTFPEGGKQGENTSGASAACFPSRCNEAGHHFVIVLGRELRCPTGAMLNLAQLLPDVYQEGSIGPCPNEAEACQKTLSCGSCSRLGGVCSFGSCRCRLGWQGADCSHSLMGVVPLSDRQPFVKNSWFEVLTVSLRVKTQGRERSARGQGEALQEVFAEWSGQPKQFVSLAKLDQRSQSDVQARVRERGLKEGTQQLQMMQRAQHSRRMHALKQALGTVLGRSGSRGLLLDLEHKEQASGLQEEVKQEAELQVVFHARPTPEEQISLSGRLASAGAVQELSAMLEGAGFVLNADSISQRLGVLMHKAVELEGDEGASKAEDGFGTAEKIITGCVVGVGGLLLLLLIPLGLLWWARSGGCCLHPHLASSKDRDTSKHSLYDAFDDEKEAPQPRSASMPFMGPLTGRMLYNPFNRRWFSEYQIPEDKGTAKAPPPLRPSGVSVAVPSSPSSASRAATVNERPSIACASLVTPFAPLPQALGPRYSDTTASALTCSTQGQMLPPPPHCLTARNPPPDDCMDLPSISPVGSAHGSFTAGAPLPTVPSMHAASGEQQPWQLQHQMLAAWMRQHASEPQAVELQPETTSSRATPSRPRMATTPLMPAVVECTGGADLQQAQGTPAQPCQAQHSTAPHSTALHDQAQPCPAQPRHEAAAAPPPAQQPASNSSPAKEAGTFAFSYSPVRWPRARHRWASANQVTPVRGRAASQSRLQASTQLPSSMVSTPLPSPSRAGHNWASANQVTPVRGSAASQSRLQASTQLPSSMVSTPQPSPSSMGFDVQQGPASLSPTRGRASAPQVHSTDDGDSSRSFQFSYTPSPNRAAGQSSFLQRLTLGALSPSSARRLAPRASEAVGARRAATPQPGSTSAYHFSYGGSFLANIFSTPTKARPQARKSAPVIGSVPDADADHEERGSKQREVKEAW